MRLDTSCTITGCSNVAGDSDESYTDTVFTGTSQVGGVYTTLLNDASYPPSYHAETLRTEQPMCTQDAYFPRVDSHTRSIVQIFGHPSVYSATAQRPVLPSYPLELPNAAKFSPITPCDSSSRFATQFIHVSGFRQL